MRRDPYRPDRRAEPDGMTASAPRDETCAASQPGTSDHGRFAELAASWWGQLRVETRSGWAGRLGAEGLAVAAHALAPLAYRRYLQDRRADELQRVRRCRQERQPECGWVYAEQVEAIEAVLILEPPDGVASPEAVAGGAAGGNAREEVRT